MAYVFGRDVRKEALLASVGDMAQVCGIQSFAFDDGPGRGVRGLEFRTGGGLRFVVLPDRAMDLYSAEYRGTPLNWLSGTGPVSPGMYSSRGWEWLRSFFGGLLTTCGLSNVGDPCDDRGAYLESEHFGGHGRISNLPARAVGYRGAWEGERYLLSAEGETVETAGQGEKLRLHRRIMTEMGKNTIEIADEVTNEAFAPVPFMFLYHINIGYPLLDTGTRVLASCTARTGMDPVSQAQVPRLGDIHAPTADAPELVFMLEMKPDSDGYCHLVVSNPALEAGRGLGLYLRYRRADFPYFHIWKRLSRREYVLGLEPGLCTIQGRVRQRERGDLRLLAPQETAAFEMEIGVLDSSEQVSRFARDHGLEAL